MSYVYEQDRRAPLLDAVLKEELEVRSEDVGFLMLTPESASARTEELIQLANDADVVVFASFVRSGQSNDRPIIPWELSEALDELLKGGRSSSQRWAIRTR